MPMPLEQWDIDVAYHLDMIRAGVDQCLDHVAKLPLRPSWETLAEADLDRCEAVLQRALEQVRRAKAAYRDKPVE